MYQALYRKYRPKNFNEVVGQNVIIKTLKNAIINSQITHAYLFTGPRGTGKTSIAKIFSKMVNCYNLNNFIPCENCVSCTQINNNQNIDVIEIDAASNNGVDEIREIRNKVTLVPTNSKYKIYIIDEVHMLTTQAFNALLKTLEEPPEHVIFILATTEPQKIPKTILSRCQRFDYKRVGIKEIVSRLKYISNEEKIKISDEALTEIAILSDGGMRDSVSLLDQAHSYCDNEITINEIHEINGTLPKQETFEFIKMIFEKNIISIIEKIETYDQEGKNLDKILKNIIEQLKNVLIYNNAPNFFESEELNELFGKYEINNDVLYQLIKNLSSALNNMKNTNNGKIIFEIEMIKNIDLNTENENMPFKKITNQKNLLEIESSRQLENPVKMQKDINSENNINNIKKIRINNSLVNVSKRNRDLFKLQLKKLNQEIDNDKFIKYIDLILEGELKVISDKNMIFVYSTNLLSDTFNNNLDSIDLIFKKVYSIDYKSVAVTNDEWEQIKNDYNTKNKIFTFIEETKINSQTSEKKQIVDEKNDIDLLFNDIIEYSEKEG